MKFVDHSHHYRICVCTQHFTIWMKTMFSLYSINAVYTKRHVKVQLQLNFAPLSVRQITPDNHVPNMYTCSKDKSERMVNDFAYFLLLRIKRQQHFPKHISKIVQAVCLKFTFPFLARCWRHEDKKHFSLFHESTEYLGFFFFLILIFFKIIFMLVHVFLQRYSRLIKLNLSLPLDL